MFLLGRVKEHHNVLRSSPRLKKACVRQVVLDRWFPLDPSSEEAWPPSTEAGRTCPRGAASSAPARLYARVYFVVAYCSYCLVATMYTYLVCMLMILYSCVVFLLFFVCLLSC